MVLQAVVAGDRVPNRHRLRAPKNTNMRKLPPSRVDGLSPARWEIVIGLTMPILFSFLKSFFWKIRAWDWGYQAGPSGVPGQKAFLCPSFL